SFGQSPSEGDGTGNSDSRSGPTVALRSRPPNSPGILKPRQLLESARRNRSQSRLSLPNQNSPAIYPSPWFDSRTACHTFHRPSICSARLCRAPGSGSSTVPVTPDSSNRSSAPATVPPTPLPPIPPSTTTPSLLLRVPLPPPPDSETPALKIPRSRS